MGDDPLFTRLTRLTPSFLAGWLGGTLKQVWEASEYALHYFDAVLRRIQERGLERLLVEFKILHKPCPDERARERLE